MKKDKCYLTTGEFAKLCHTSKHTLFHYCDIGLFPPAYTDDNGYRYYHILQFDSFLTITQLQLTGMPLSEIKKYMAERSPKRIIEMYSQQEQALSVQISRLKQLKERVRNQKDNMEQALNCSEKCFLEKHSKAYLLCSDMISEIDNYAMTSAIGNLIYSANTQISSNTLGMLCNLNDVMASEHYPCRFYVYMYSPKQKKHIAKSSGNYLTAYHQGVYETLGKSCKRLIEFAKKNDMQLDSLIYAETIIGDWAVHSPKDYIIKISAKVKISYY